MDGLTIGGVAKKAGVNRETLRYYERRGLMLPLSRSDSGYRLYSEEAPKVVRFIKRAKSLGFSLDEVEGLLSLRQNSQRSCADVRALASERLADIDLKISQLQAVRSRLAELASACSAGGLAPDCPMLDSLQNDEEPPS